MKEFENEFEIENQFAGDDIYNINMIEMPSHDMMEPMPFQGNCSFKGPVIRPVMERPIVKCEHRRIVHEVPHIQPVTTKIINHHEYKHTCHPRFNTICENKICHTGCGCKGFKY